jgi:hypothetical protein
VSSSHEIWPLIGQLSGLLDGNRQYSEQKLDELQAQIKSLPDEFRDVVRRQMILIVAGLARLEVRLIEAHGPLDMAV